MRASTIGDGALSAFPSVSAGAVEAMKWAGAGLMLLEHYFRYVAGELPAIVYLLGRLVFPLFVFAFALGVRGLAWSKFPGLIVRLCSWGVAAQLGLALAAPEVLVLNVLFTFALGASIAWAVSCSRSAVSFLGVIGGALVAGWWCEFGLWGVAFVASAVMLARAARPSWALVGLVLASFAGLSVPNGTAFAVAALPVAWLIDRAGFSVARIPRAFYWVYALQFPAFAALAWASS